MQFKWGTLPCIYSNFVSNTLSDTKLLKAIISGMIHIVSKKENTNFLWGETSTTKTQRVFPRLKGFELAQHFTSKKIGKRKKFSPLNKILL